jgi:hypothetical protein
MTAANSGKDTRSAAYALIPSTIIYTTSDEIVTPQLGDMVSLSIEVCKVHICFNMLILLHRPPPDLSGLLT